MKFSQNDFRFSFAEAVVLREEMNAAVGTVTTLPPDSPAQVTLEREGNTLQFSFGIPQGEAGEGSVLDEEMSDDSGNPVRNRVIKAYVDDADSLLSSEIAELSDRLDTLCFVPELPMSGGDSAPTLFSGIFYLFPEMTTLDLTLSPPEDPTVVNEFRFRFTSGSTPTVLSLPASVKGELQVEANRVYEVSILDDYLVSQSWEVLT